MTHCNDNTTTRLLCRRLVTAGAAMLAAPLAQAHHAMDGATPTTFFEGLMSGLAHPVIGPDHLAFLLIVALLSAGVGGTRRYLLPMGFVAATLAGTLYHLGAADLPMAETVIALSVLLGGLAVLWHRRLPALLLGGLFGLIGVFHGYAYGESIVGAEPSPMLAYLLGFALIQYAVIVGVMQVVRRLSHRSERLQALALRGSGALTAAGGVVFLGMSLS